MGIKRINDTFFISARDRGVRMVVAAKSVDEAISLLRHASEFYLHDTASRPPKRRERAAPAVEEKVVEEKVKDKIIYKIKYKDEDTNEIIKYEVRQWLENQLADGAKSLDSLAADLAPFARSASGAKLTTAQKLKAARRTVRTYGINKRVPNIILNEDGELQLVEAANDEE